MIEETRNKMKIIEIKSQKPKQYSSSQTLEINSSERKKVRVLRLRKEVKTNNKIAEDIVL